jgi:uracil-DNA glycosylase family 4
VGGGERCASLLRAIRCSFRDGLVAVATANRLAALYEEIHAFAVERDRGVTVLAPRQVVARALESDLVLLGQGLAESTQRVTGYPYRKPDGLSVAGRRLDAFLRPLGQTIDHSATDRAYVYSTDLVPWYPGKDPRGSGDQRPHREEIDQCWRFFEAEIALVQPRAILLLGRWTAGHFLRKYSDARLTGRLEDASRYGYRARIGSHDVVAVPAFHPAAIWGRFEQAGRTSWRRAVQVLAPILDRKSDAKANAPRRLRVVE